MQETKTGTERNQAAPYQDPPGLETRLLEEFEPVTIRGYVSAGGRLAFEANAECEVAYAYQLNHCQQLLNMDLLSRVDVVRLGTTELLGSMVRNDPQEALNKRLAQIRLAARG